MAKTNNVWIQTNAKLITETKRKLIEHNYAGGYGGSLNLMQINNILDGALIEITKLQKENEELKKTDNVEMPDKN